MFGNKIKFSASSEQMDSLRRQYRQYNKTDDEVAQFMMDNIMRDPNFHTKALPKNRTDSDGKVTPEN